MGDKSAIEWTDATWNPTTGCDKVSAGCANCYAERVSKRLQGMGQPKYSEGFAFRQHVGSLREPYKWKKPRRIFVNSMSDLFHPDNDFDFIDMVFRVMLDNPQHVYQILTKRPDIMADYSNRYTWNARPDTHSDFIIPKNIWLGTSVENYDAKLRIGTLRHDVSCRRKFISFEPLIGDVGQVNLQGIDWAIIGGESGPNYRTMKREWAESLIRQCEKQGVPIFFKQWGGRLPGGHRTIFGRIYDEFPA